MVHHISFRHTTLRVVSEGKGIPMVLLHGYLESLNIWDPFVPALLPHCKVIRIDLPGHGKSGMAAPVHTMEIMAESVLTTLNALSVKTCYLLGHSMGGYVTLACAKAFVERLLGFCLFHSTPFADTEEKKTNRDREIELVIKGKKELIIRSNIPKGFADENLERCKSEVERAGQIALDTPDAGIIAALEGMKRRTDTSAVILQSPIPVLWILGQKDNYIIYNTIKEKIKVGPNGRILTLKNAGHMGFIEEPEPALKALVSFVNSTA
jgi:pimeloyl-ACP methyl ester carboxylesterase